VARLARARSPGSLSPFQIHSNCWRIEPNFPPHLQFLACWGAPSTKRRLLNIEIMDSTCLIEMSDCQIRWPRVRGSIPMVEKYLLANATEPQAGRETRELRGRADMDHLLPIAKTESGQGLVWTRKRLGCNHASVVLSMLLKRHSSIQSLNLPQRRPFCGYYVRQRRWPHARAELTLKA